MALLRRTVAKTMSRDMIVLLTLDNVALQSTPVQRVSRPAWCTLIPWQGPVPRLQQLPSPRRRRFQCLWIPLRLEHSGQTRPQGPLRAQSCAFVARFLQHSFSMFTKSVISFAAACLFLGATAASAQHQGHTMPMPTDTAKKPVATKKKPAATKKKPAVKKPGVRPNGKPKPSSTPAGSGNSSVTTMPAQGMAAMTHDSVMHKDSVKHEAAAAGHTMDMKGPEKMPTQHLNAHGKDSIVPGMAGMKASKMDMMSGPLGISMDRMGSGTTWIPDAVKMPSRHRMMGDWEVMTHGFVFAQYDKQSGPRGDDQLGSLNWMMLMASKRVGGGTFQARTMLSLDALTVTEKGYPLLLQTGETFDGEPLHDRQHPHDFWMELGALYQREINSSLAWSVYAAPSGEPALGPVAFMHRPSAMDVPSAPLSHHWQDATHVSFGAVTLGLFGRRWQLEASSFNGREPDQNRWNFDPLKLDSYSGRFTFNPNENWSFTAGAGYLKTPESLHPDESMVRYTASAMHGRRIGTTGQVATTLIWGANKHEGQGLTHSVLGESEAIIDKYNTFFGRAEFVQKTAEDLVVASMTGDRFNVATLQTGYIREIARTRWATIGLGGSGTINFVPAALESQYGSRTPTGLFVFLRLRPFFAEGAHGDSMPGGHSSVK